MNFERSLIFSHLEEDNIQRAYFRVRPLLTTEGNAQEEAVQLWPNEGGLRIVPDRNEQHTFKGRMRSLGDYCVVDLRGLPAEAGKIRTNKNFRPERGEVNQYILYSDTVHPLPENTFYQLLDGAASDFAVLAEKAITPLFFIRENETLYGPVRKVEPALPQAAEEAAAMLFDVPCPDGVTRQILCMNDTPAKEVTAEPAEKPVQEQLAPVKPEQPAPKPVQEKKAPDEVLPIGKSLQILDEGQSTDDTLRQLDKPVSADANLLHQRPAKVTPVFDAPARQTGTLSGTPLVRAPLHVSTQQNKNRTQEVVSTQWNVGKYEPPAMELPAGAKLRNVANPVESACQQLRTAWNATSAHERLVDCILSLDGIRGQLEAKLCKGSNQTILQRVLRDRLQDLEAERLTALCELDKARKDVDTYKQELLTGLANRIARDTASLEADKQRAQTEVDALKGQITGLLAERDVLAAHVDELKRDVLPETVGKLFAEAQMIAPTAGIPLRMTSIPGEDVVLEALIERLQGACEASGAAIDRNTAIALLVLLGISQRIGISCATPAAAATLMDNVASAMGWKNSFAHQVDAEQRPCTNPRPVDGTPAILLTSLPSYAPLGQVTKLMLNRSVAPLTHQAAYDASQWPIIAIPALSFVPELPETSAAPVSAASLAKIAEHASATNADVDAVLAPVLSAAQPLSGAARKDLTRFVSVCAGLMEGGLPVAADWGIRLWIVPAVDGGSKQYHAVKPLLDEYPLSLADLK